jgi:hypothetical protein
MCGSCATRWRDAYCTQDLNWNAFKGGDLSLDGRIVLKCITMK